VAEPYPRGLCQLLGRAVAIDSGRLPKQRKLNLAACARVSQEGVGGFARIGEAGNPGPRPKQGEVRYAEREGIELEDVETLAIGTIKMRNEILGEFQHWLGIRCLWRLSNLCLLARCCLSLSSVPLEVFFLRKGNR